MPAANITPLFPVTPVVAIAHLTASNTSLDGTGSNLVTLTPAPGTNGGRYEYFRVVAAGTTTAGMIRIFINDGSSKRLWLEIPVTPATPSSTVSAFSAEVIPTRPLVLPSGYSLVAATENAEVFNVFAMGGDF